MLLVKDVHCAKKIFEISIAIFIHRFLCLKFCNTSAKKKSIALINSKRIKRVFIKKCREVSQKILARKADYWIGTNSMARAKKQ